MIPPLSGCIHLLVARLLRVPATAGVLLPLVATLAETAIGVLAGAVSLSVARLAASVAKR